MVLPWLSAAARAVVELIEPPASAPFPSLADVIARLQQIDIADAIDAGFSFSDPADHSGRRDVYARRAGDLPAGTFALKLSPERGHRALQWHEHASDQLRLWIDQREIALPLDSAGDRLIEPYGFWFSERFFAAESLMPYHPQQDFSRAPGTGQVRGLLICDAKNGGQRLEQPGDDEIWTQPLPRVQGNRMRIYADRAMYDADTPAREWIV